MNSVLYFRITDVVYYVDSYKYTYNYSQVNFVSGRSRFFYVTSYQFM